MRNKVIFAPHIDDEVIGCWRILSKGEVSDVYYFYDCTPERQSEAIAASRKFGFVAHFVKPGELPTIDKDKIIYLPHIRDAHHHHKLVNYAGKTYPNAQRYYSVDMSAPFDVLDVLDQSSKRIDLLELFPSQHKLLSDDKYHLFECDVESDVRMMQTFTCTHCEIVIERTAEPIENIVKKVNSCGTDINKILTMFPFRYIKIKTKTAEYEFTP